MRRHIEAPLIMMAVTLAVGACQSTPRASDRERDEAPAVQWQLIADSANQVAFLDPGSLRQTSEGLRATVKINYSTPQTFGRDEYRSVRSTYILDCTGRRIADRENEVYGEPDLQGERVRRAARATGNLIWRDAVSGSIDGELLTSACRRGAP